LSGWGELEGQGAGIWSGGGGAQICGPGGDVSFIVEELKAVFDPRGGQWAGGRYVPSLLAAIGEVIERHLIDIGFMPGATEESDVQRAAVAVAVGEGAAVRRCPRCGASGLLRLEGCDTCISCGYSKCA
jgi:ribonucleoside-diphosphate reductase alpha chain